MKRIVTLLICILAAFPLFAQQNADYVLPSVEVNRSRKMNKEKMWAEFPKLEVRVGYSGFPIVDVLIYGLDGLDILDPSAPGGYGSLEHMYSPAEGATYLTGNFNAEFSWHIKPWFTLAGGLYFNGVYGSTVDPSDGSLISRDRGVTLSFIPTARFYWANFKNCRLYSSCGLGFSTSFGFKDVSFFGPAIQFTPIGVTAGRRVFFFGEYSYGSVYFGGQIGVGYRF